ncbi:MAG: hypothetical protein HQL64_04745 [Magnetococcales bacterium]|nr:hypothetical protein [Magnetococcales bacterium]
MFSKIILTGLIMFGVYLLGRYHVIRRLPPLSETPFFAPAPLPGLKRAAAARFVGRHGSRLPWIVGVVVISLTLGAFYRSWRDSEKILQIRVINASNGQITHYEAHKKQVHMRTFQTLDGRLVTLADVERMEVSEPE